MWNKIKKWMPSKRKWMQLYFALLFNCNIKGFVTGRIFQGDSKIMCAPGINCYSCPGAVGACPLGSFQGSFSADHSTIYYVGGILLLYSMMFGRMICGWLCPFGFIQELLHKIKTPKLKKSPVTRILSYLKYAILVFFVLIVPITYAFRDTPLPAFCKYICPAGTFEGGLALLSNAANESYFSMLGPLFTWKFLLMVSILVGCVFVFRLFCRFICPLGALYGLFNRISVFGIKVEKHKCTECGLCISHCKVDIRKVGDQECISCGECVDVCPTQAITWKGSKLFLRKNEVDTPTPEKHKKARLVTRIISAVLLLGILIGVAAYAWVNAPDSAVVGTEIGQPCFNGFLNVVDENGPTGKVISPATNGKVTVINFWGTWCSPCVAELPYFDQIAQEYGERICVVAIHSKMSGETAPEFIGKHYPDSQMVFAFDAGGNDAVSGLFYENLGGSGAYPYTLVLDENGVISDIRFDALHYEDLKDMVEAALAK